MFSISYTGSIEEQNRDIPCYFKPTSRLISVYNKPQCKSKQWMFSKEIDIIMALNLKFIRYIANITVLEFSRVTELTKWICLLHSVYVYT